MPARLAHEDDDVTVLCWSAGTVYRAAVFAERSESIALLARGGWVLGDWLPS